MMSSTLQGNPVAEWRQLVAAALLGTDRIGDSTPAVGGTPAALLEHVPGEDDAAGRLLKSASVLGLYQLVGQQAPQATSTVSPISDDDDIHACSLRAGQQLSRILQGEFELLLGDWCALAAAKGVRAPDEQLPLLLDRLIGGEAELDGTQIEAVLGKRGRWLATMNPAWQGEVERPDAEAAWKTGTQEERMAAVALLRLDDPEKARELVTETWAEESPQDRAVIIMACFGLDPTMDDEVFLEAALDDGRKVVRSAAADTLAEVQDSRYCARMSERLRLMLFIRRRKALVGKGKLSIEVTLPKSLDTEMARDGIEDKRQHGMGKKTHVFCQILGRAPMSALDKQVKATPDELVEAARVSDWREPLLVGWSEAAIRQESSEWALALLRAYFADPVAFPGIEMSQLASRLDVPVRERMALEVLSREPCDLGRHPVLSLLEGCDHAWSADLSHAVLASLKRYFGTEQAEYEHGFRKTVSRDFSRHLSIEVCEAVTYGWNRDNDYWHKGDDDMVDRLAATLELRRAMHEELGNGKEES